MNRSLVLLLVVFAAVFGVVLSSGADPKPGGPATVFKNARLIDGTGSPPVADRVMVIRGGKIEAVGAAGEVAIPAGAEIIDLAGKSLMPALVATHAHLGFVNGTKTSSANVTEENVLRQMERYAAYGVGTVTSLGADGDFIYRLREARRKEPSVGAAILTAGLGFGAMGGVPPLASGFTEIKRPATADEAREQVRELAKLKPDFVKIWIDDAGGTLPVRMTREVRTTIIDEAHRHGLKVAAHVYYLADAKSLVDEGVDVLAHSIRDKEVDDELIQAMKERGVSYIPTLFLDEAFFAYADQPEWMSGDFFRKSLEPGAEKLIEPGTFKEKAGSREILRRASTNLKRLHEGGVKIGLGTDSGATPLRVQGFAEHRELQLLVAAGITPLEVIHIGTGGGAEVIGEGSRTGTLAPGKQADFLVLGGDPTEDIRNTEKLEAIWIGGKKR